VRRGNNRAIRPSSTGLRDRLANTFRMRRDVALKSRHRYPPAHRGKLWASPPSRPSVGNSRRGFRQRRKRSPTREAGSHFNACKRGRASTTKATAPRSMPAKIIGDARAPVNLAGSATMRRRGLRAWPENHVFFFFFCFFFFFFFSFFFFPEAWIIQWSRDQLLALRACGKSWRWLGVHTRSEPSLRPRSRCSAHLEAHRLSLRGIPARRNISIQSSKRYNWQTHLVHARPPVKKGDKSDSLTTVRRIRTN